MFSPRLSYRKEPSSLKQTSSTQFAVQDNYSDRFNSAFFKSTYLKKAAQKNVDNPFLLAMIQAGVNDEAYYQKNLKSTDINLNNQSFDNSMSFQFEKNQNFCTVRQLRKQIHSKQKLSQIAKAIFLIGQSIQKSKP